jgi:hypothetical protein
MSQEARHRPLLPAAPAASRQTPRRDCRA